MEIKNDSAIHEKIQIKVLEKRSAIEINSRHPNRVFIIDEIMLGIGSHRKAIKYTNGLLKYSSEHNAEIIAPGKIRII